MPVEVLVESIDWDNDRIAGVAYESSIEILQTQVEVVDFQKFEIARGIKNGDLPLVDFNICEGSGIPIIVFTAPVGIEIIPDGELVVHDRSPEARLAVRPVFLLEDDSYIAKNKWEAIKKTLGELASSFRLRREPYLLEVVFPIQNYARDIRINKAVLI